MQSSFELQQHQVKRHRMSGFTLVEMLMVIVIIGILASLILVAGNAAMKTARKATIKAGITQVEMALEQYKNKYGEYPPDFSDSEAVMRHVRKRWPRFNTVRYSNSDIPLTLDLLVDQIVQRGWNIATMTKPGTKDAKINTYNPDGIGHLAAITFWLGGLPDNSGMLGGFSADVSNPFDTSSGQREKPMMDMTIGDNVKEVNGVYAYYAYKQPVVYFKANYAQKDDATKPKCFHDDIGDLGCAVPYIKGVLGNKILTDSNGDIIPGNAIWYNPKTFQLIHPGLDSTFGIDDHDFRAVDPTKEVAVKIENEDRDNIANFGGTTIGD